MFEFFLDQGFKQTEGQFFTPLPIVRFILMSLPLSTILEDSPEMPQVIDYACGAGHFLTELALQIKPFIENVGKDPHIYYANIYGIEKEYRLSKVAKVSTFMYGQGETNIIYADALMQHPQIWEGDFKILISNPPYSVKGFLETLPEHECKRYELIETVDEKSYPTNNSIESFFIECAKQLLAPGGVAAIIAPTSILSTADRTYTRTREILLQYFDIVALVEFPGGTFGKTGSNTITLFLRRKDDNPPLAAHYRNRVEDWFKGDKAKDTVFQDEHLLTAYCTHIGITFDSYKTLCDGSPNQDLLDNEIFKAYRQDFDDSTEIKNLKKRKTFNNKSVAEQQTELASRFLAYLRTIEKDKVYYFLLTYTQPNPVIIARSPDGTKERTAFLGYEWSSRKGDEGIKLHYDAGGKHNTPLYDPDGRDNPEKINYYIHQNFIGESPDLPETLGKYLSAIRLMDLIDFGRVKFDKQIGLSPQKVVKIPSKWPNKKLGDKSIILEIINGGTPDTGNPTYWDGNILWATLVDLTDKYIENTERHITDEGLQNSNATLIPKNAVVWSSRATIGRTAITKVPLTTNQGFKSFVCNSSELDYEYLYYLLGVFQQTMEDLVPPGTKYKEINTTTIKDFNIPVPPLVGVQQKIVAECQAIDISAADILDEGIPFAKITDEIEKRKQAVLEKYLQ